MEKLGYKNIDILFNESGADSFMDFWLGIETLIIYAESLAREGTFTQGAAKCVILDDLQELITGEPGPWKVPGTVKLTTPK